MKRATTIFQDQAVVNDKSLTKFSAAQLKQLIEAIHARGREVTKTHASSIEAFKSGDFGFWLKWTATALWAGGRLASPL